MAKKKSKKPNVSAQALERARQELYSGDTAATAVIEEAPVADAPASAPPRPLKAKPAVTTEELSNEYAYVLSDLKSMFILAGVLFVAMVIVSLLIDMII